MLFCPIAYLITTPCGRKEISFCSESTYYVKGSKLAAVLLASAVLGLCIPTLSSKLERVIGQQRQGVERQLCLFISSLYLS